MDKDDIEYENGNLQEQSELELLVVKRNEKKVVPNKHKPENSVLAIFTVVLLLFVSGAYLYREKVFDLAQHIKEKAQTAVTTGNKVEMKIENGSKTTFVGFGNSYLYCTKDGVKYFDGGQNQKWNSTYTMTSPSVVNNGSYTAVAEAQGRSVKVYSENGELYSVSADGIIMQISVNSIGSTCLILKTDSGYKVQVYDEKGSLIMERFDEDKGVYPIAVDISTDKKVLAVSYLDTTDIEMVSKVLFFYTGREDTKNTESGDFFASVEKVGEIVPAIKYMNNGIFIAVGDTNVFTIDISGKEIWSDEISNKIEKIAFTDEYLIMALGEPLPGKDGAQKGTIRIFGKAGKQNYDYTFSKSVTYLKAYKNGMVIGSNRDFMALNYNGKLLWEHTATQDVKDIILMSSAENVLYVTNNSAEIININKGVQ
ncbi:MAG: DUF5711 family protein [Lachnospiraceae bacterium]|nr:DUF5711 family protein [Lachnospiraceae bacterium]